MVTAFTFLANVCPADQAALMDFKAALKEPYLGIFNTWTGNNCCQGWNGVSCDQTSQQVAAIILRGETEDLIYEKAGRSGYMTGALSRSLCKLDKLRTLIVADWKDVSSIVNLRKLKHLKLSNNQLSGIIPADIRKLQMMSQALLNKNKLTGSILNAITQLRWLADLDLSMNEITGSLPQEV